MKVCSSYCLLSVIIKCKTMIDFIEKRIQKLGQKDNTNGKYVLYWMQASQRIKYNFASDYAIFQAQRLDLPLVVIFFVVPNYNGANSRHYSFMLENILQIKRKLELMGITFIVEVADPILRLVELSKDASLLVLDKGYLAVQRNWYEDLFFKTYCPVYQVEDNELIPVDAVSTKEEYSAFTLRIKYLKVVRDFISKLEIDKYERNTEQLWNTKNKRLKDLSFKNIEINSIISTLKTDDSVKYTKNMIRSGEDEAIKQFDDFMNKRLSTYQTNRNNYTDENTSRMSAYLHFGQISPIYLVGNLISKYSTDNQVSIISKDYRLCDSLGLKRDENLESFLEQLLIRRHLAMNFVSYNKNYTNFRCLPNWAIKTLVKHKSDKRLHNYTVEQLENSQTHDKVWNKAQTDLVNNGYMHGYLRMYWGKKIIEWMSDPEIAYETIVYLNDKYQLMEEILMVMQRWLGVLVNTIGHGKKGRYLG